MIVPKTQIITVEIREIAPRLFRTYSEELPGLKIAADSRQALINDLPTVIKAMLGKQGFTAEVIKLEREELGKLTFAVHTANSSLHHLR